MSRRIIAPILWIFVIALQASADGGKVEPVGAFADQSASEAVRKAIEPKGYRVTLADGSAVCDIWLRSAVSTRPKTEASGIYYSELLDSTFIGVISVAKAGSDYRGQGLKPGIYTMRYAQHPSDGNHLGISAYRDFLLLVPVAADPDPDANYKFEELAKMSAKASGTNHPSPLSMVAPELQKTAPAVTQNHHGHLVFVASLKTRAGAELPIAFVVKGVAEQ